MSSQPTQDQLQEYKEAFTLYAEEEGTITQRELGIVLTALGHHPSDTELRDIVSEVSETGSGNVTFSEFLKLMSILNKDDIRSEADLKQAFQVFDVDDTHVISAEDLRYVMTHVGSNPFSEDEAKEKMKEVGIVNNEAFHYKDMVDLVIAAASE